MKQEAELIKPTVNGKLSAAVTYAYGSDKDTAGRKQDQLEKK